MVILTRYAITLEKDGTVSSMKAISQVDTDITPQNQLEPDILNVVATFEGEIYAVNDVKAIRKARQMVQQQLKQVLQWKPSLDD